MTNNVMIAEGGIEGRMIERAEAALAGMEALRLVLERKTRELSTMSEADLKVAGLETLQRELARAVTVSLVEEGKVFDVLREKRGGDGIDFAAARASLGSKLDRLAERLAEG